MAHRLPARLSVSPRVAVPTSEIELSFAASGGPGGQNVNKVHSKAVLRWNPARSVAIPPADRERTLRRLAPRLTVDGDLVLSSDRRRDQPRNVRDVLERLVEILREALSRPVVRRETRPTRASRRRRLDEKRARGDVKRSRRSVARDD